MDVGPAAKVVETGHEFLEHLIDAGPTLMFRENLPDRLVTYASGNFERVLGFELGQVYATPRFFSQHIVPADRSRFETFVAAVISGQPHERGSDYELIDAAGNRRWFVVDLGLQSVDGADVLIGHAADVTDRVEAERAANEAVERYQAIFTGVPSGIFRSAASGEILEANRKLAEIFGYASVEKLKREVPDVGVLYLDRHDRLRFIESVVAEGSVQNFETKIRRRTGEVIDVSMNASVVRDGEGNVLGFEGTLLDVTVQRSAEENARRAWAEADRANQAKSVFLSRMSHELRTPLNSIIGFAQLLELRQPDPEVADSVHHIIKGGRHLLELINEILDIAKVEAGRIGLSIEPVRLGEVVVETLALIRPLAAARSISISYEGDQEFERYVLADRQRLKQVLLNLLSNAVKYNRDGGTVVVTSSIENEVVSVAVADTGPGITPEQLERLFVPFERLDAEATGEEGTGLGLSLSRHLTDAMGGVLEVSSTYGQGSTFAVALPSSLAPLDMPGVAMAMSNPDGARAAVSLHSVLYIEDNIASISLVEQILALRPGLSVETSMQGRLGVSLAREHRPDLILLDLNLADVSGRDVLAELKADPRTQPIPVLMISADASPGQIQRLLDGGAAGYLTKPLDVPQFLGEVDRLLQL